MLLARPKMSQRFAGNLIRSSTVEEIVRMRPKFTVEYCDRKIKTSFPLSSLET